MVFHSASEECFKWLNKQPSVKEETLTDWLLYFISEHTSRVQYMTFSRNQESSIGADWEWWILTNCVAYRFLIQAKKLKINKDNYPLIAYGNRNGLQIDLLTDEAKKRGAIALYAYYCNTLPDTDTQIRQVEYIDASLFEWCRGCKNGCFLSSAYDVKKQVLGVARNRVSSEQLIDNSFGISILDLFVKCNPYKRILQTTVCDYLENIDKHDAKFSGRNKQARYNLWDLPQYIVELINRSQSEKLEWYEKEFSNETADLSGVALLDLRDEHCDFGYYGNR